MDGVIRKTKSWAPAILTVLLAIAWLAFIATTWAEAAEGERSPASAAQRAPANDDDGAPPRSDDSYDFNWLDPDKRIYVLQNRRYLKTNRIVLSLMGGPSFGGAYRTTYFVTPRLGYYFNEQFGIEAFYQHNFNSDNSTYKALVEAGPNSGPAGDPQVLPLIREIRSSFGGMIQWVPWYAKINVFNTIIYFDWYFAGGAGMVNTATDTRQNKTQASTYATQSNFALYWGTGHIFHWGQRLKVRLDMTSSNYNAEINPASLTTHDKTWYSNYNFALGFGVAL